MTTGKMEEGTVAARTWRRGIDGRCLVVSGESFMSQIYGGEGRTTM